MVEYTDRKWRAGGRPARRGPRENVVALGSEARRGATLVARGTRVTHATVAIAAAIGRPEIAVYRRPRVAILATGDELVDIGRHRDERSS